MRGARRAFLSTTSKAATPPLPHYLISTYPLNNGNNDFGKEVPKQERWSVDFTNASSQCHDLLIHTRSTDLPSVSPRKPRRTNFAIHHDTQLESSRAPSNTTFGGSNEDCDVVKDIRSAKRARRYCQSASNTPVVIPSRPESGRIPKHEVRLETSISPDNDLTDSLQEDDKENIFQLPTPRTPRHKKVSVKVPITPRHRIGLVGKPFTPKSSSASSTPEKEPSTYNAARQLFTRSADPGRLIGREEERNCLASFIDTCVEEKCGHAMYVSGPPGTGKSALVGEVCNSLKESNRVRQAHINCMGIKRPGEVLEKLLNELNIHIGPATIRHNTKLPPFLAQGKHVDQPMYVVTLDEMDHLLNVDLDVLYCLFEWALQRGSRLVLIGIANALDLTDRFLPLLKTKQLRPQLLPFLPYTALQISEVISRKLYSLITPAASSETKDPPFVHPAAVQLCSKKVASQTGDLRKAFDIIRRSLELIEHEAKQKVPQAALQTPDTTPSKSKPALLENPNQASHASRQTLGEASNAFMALTPTTAPRATIAHVSRVSAAAFSHGTAQRLQTLHLQQKAALCALIAYEKHSRGSKKETSNSRDLSSIFSTPTKKRANPTARILYETYSTLCKRESALHPLTMTEFADVINGLETLGLLGVATGREGKAGPGSASSAPSGRKRKGFALNGNQVGSFKSAVEEKRFVSFVNEKEMEDCLAGVGGEILRGLLRGDE